MLSTISVMANCTVVIGGDTGPMHCAAAGVPTITLFGPTDSELIGPYGENAIYVYGENKCIKCFSGCSEKGYNCEEGLGMKSIYPERVYEEVKKICSNGI